jgi:hypothetical protein
VPWRDQLDLSLVPEGRDYTEKQNAPVENSITVRAGRGMAVISTRCRDGADLYVTVG